MIRDDDSKTVVPLTHSGLRLGLILTVVFVVVSSPIIIFNLALAATPSASSRPLPTISTIPSAPSTIGQDGKEGDFTTQAAISSLSTRPTNNIVNTNSFYDVVFLTATAGTIKTIQVTFPVGTAIPSGAFFNEGEGIGPGTASKSGQTITYTVTNAVNVPAGTKIRLEFANINNPLQVSANYKVTVTTRDAANAIIDGPTQSTAYTMKQIGVNAIADGSITSTKPAESFMKRVTVLDNAAGHAVGWDPNGSLSEFGITEPDISANFNEPFFNVRVTDTDGDGVGICTATGNPIVAPHIFVISCDFPIPDGAILHYVVGNLPAHVVE